MNGNSATRGIDETFKAELLAKLAEIKSGVRNEVTEPKKKRIRSEIQSQVDSYIEIDAEVKKLQAELKGLRENIESYMKDKNVNIIPGSVRGSVSLKPRSMAIVNSRYTSYDIKIISDILDKKTVKRCLVEVVDKEVLESLVKIGDAPKEVLQTKITKSTPVFIVDHK